MRRLLSYLIWAALLFGICADVHAVAVPNYSIAETNPAVNSYSLDWDYIYRYKSCSSVAVDHYWILTAAHVADDLNSNTDIVINNETYAQQEIVFHPTADLALVRYNKPFPGYYLLHDDEIYDGTKRYPTYQELVMVGYGFAGTVADSSFTQTPATSGTKRWGTNKGEREGTVNIDVGGTVGVVSTECFDMDFNLTETDFEAGANTYDSGGPVFIDDGTDWKLTGINLYRGPSLDPPYTVNSAAMIHDYIGWITNSIPDYDTDMDGLPDWWEASHGETEAGADPDEDGFTNYEEWLADTLPNDRTSCLALGEYANATHVVFSSSTNRKYEIQYRTNLMDTNEIWQTEAGNDWFTVSGTQTVRSVSTPTSRRFYRVRTKLR